MIDKDFTEEILQAIKDKGQNDPRLGVKYSIPHPVTGIRRIYIAYSIILEPGKHKGWINLKSCIRPEFNRDMLPGYDWHAALSNFERYVKTGYAIKLC